MVEVVRQRPAFDAMDAIIRANLDRLDEISEALREIDEELRTNPLGAGESRNRPYRIATSGPLSVYYRPAQ